MRVLVIGSGAREHALAWKLSQEAEVICAPGNPGIAQDVEVREADLRDIGGTAEMARGIDPDLVVVGPEDPLIAGLANRLRGVGISTFGPEADAARLEGSKAFSKNAMARAGIPTARFREFSAVDDAREYARAEFGAGRPVVVKASGAALGKGVFVAADLKEALEAIERTMVAREFGAAGETVVLEERLLGREFSLLTLVGDRNFVSLPVAQDYKRAFEGDKGPNTGGMGAYSPCSWVSGALVAEVEQTMVKPILREIGGSYRGSLFTGVMLTEDGPKCLEYNVRLGDPETQTVLRRLGGGFLEALRAAAEGEEIRAPEVLGNAAVAVVVASAGYPGAYAKGRPITVGDLPEGGKLFWAGVGDGFATSGGRVVTATGVGATVEAARERAYGSAEAVNFEGAFFRRDVALCHCD